MDITSALLCDFAQVRDGVLFVASGGITRLWRDDLPATLDVYLAIVVQMDDVEAERPHELRVIVSDEDGAQIAEVRGGFQIGAQGLQIGEQIQIPMPFDFRGARIEHRGAYEFRVYVDNEIRRTLTAWVLPSIVTEPPLV